MIPGNQFESSWESNYFPYLLNISGTKGDDISGKRGVLRVDGFRDRVIEGYTHIHQIILHSQIGMNDV